jgi:hypothetical protein
MATETIEARGHTTQDGMLNLSVHVGLADAEVSVVMQVKPLEPVGDMGKPGEPRANVEGVAESMPESQPRADAWLLHARGAARLGVTTDDVMALTRGEG